MKKILKNIFTLTLIAFICSLLIYLAYSLIGGVA